MAGIVEARGHMTLFDLLVRPGIGLNMQRRIRNEQRVACSPPTAGLFRDHGCDILSSSKTALVTQLLLQHECALFLALVGASWLLMPLIMLQCSGCTRQFKIAFSPAHDVASAAT